MADRGDTHYQVNTLNRWFAFSSLVLLVSAVWMVLDDWSRPWKLYQREFRQIEVERAREELAAPEAQAAIAREAELTESLAQAEANLGDRRKELEDARADLRNLKADQFRITEAEKKAKQEFNWERWVTEEHIIHGAEKEPLIEGLQGFDDRKAGMGLEKLEIDAAVVAQQQRIDTLLSDLGAIEDDIKETAKSIDLVRKRLASMAPEDFPTQLANIIRDFPGIDFIGPNLKVRKVLPPDLTFELNFIKKRRVDMCQSCHMAADRMGFDDEEHPYQSHPRLDLFLSAKSPHPLSQIGCTICHRGSGEALDFQRTDHRPSDVEEGERWYDEYHWHKQHYWDYPMLASGYIEASCVQCHQSSMELIEPEAPKVSEGYQLFERYGCYACHKVEWFPTKRRPGPSLKGIVQKTDADFVNAWVTNPRAFRPTTWMPQVFHLENYAPDVQVVVSEYGAGRPMMGDEWSDAAVASVSSFIVSRSDKTELAPIPAGGDADRGRETFRLVGCLSCHNMAPYTEEEREETGDPALQLRDTNEHGPNLRGIATKVSPRWLFEWILDPAAYWSETRMPDLRLSEEEAADIVAYVFDDPDDIFADVPEGWEEGPVAYERDVLEEQARWFFNRTLPNELERRFEEDWADDQALLAAVGEKWVLNQGCHSCHEIAGLEDAQAIGTELTNWSSKTVDKLDFGFMPDILAKERGWSYHEKTEFKQYRENFLEQKLREPRSYDRQKVKNPTERLRMPWFDLTEEQIEAISTFVVGLVDDEVQRAKLIPTPAQASMDLGLRVIRQKNCAACHLIEPGLIEFDDENGHPWSVRRQLLTIDESYDPLPPPLEGFHDYVAGYEADMEEELEEVIVQLLETVPGLGGIGTTVVVEDVASVKTEAAWGGDFVDLVTGDYLFEEDVEDVDGERRSFVEEPYEKVRWTYAPPVLLDQGSKVQREWFYRFLLDPMRLREQLRVRMPTFNWGDGEAGAVADYFAYRAQETWPQRYARKLMNTLGKTPEEIVLEMVDRGISGSTAAQIDGIANGDKVATAAGIEKLRAYGDAVGFAMSGPVDPSYQAIPQRTPSFLDPILAADPSFLEKVHNLATSADGPTCTQCHFNGGEPPTNDAPIGWAPDLRYTRERLRPDWIRDWMTDPSLIYPGTTMPGNFQLEGQWQDLYPGTGREQIEAVTTWLFNLDRALVRN